MPAPTTMQAVEPPTIDPGMRIYYTNRAPAEINNDARDASNVMPGGSTRWCQASEFGQAGCPADIGQHHRPSAPSPRSRVWARASPTRSASG